jgi:two-component system, chemotaxis family, protein-glutamate methylesterase/glutaminase
MPEENSKPRLLVVDESVIHRRLLTDILSEMAEVGQAQAAANAKIALARLALSPVDLVLFDLDCQQEGGLEAIKAIRQGYPEAAVVAMGRAGSGPDPAQASRAMRALELGALEVVVKPSDKADPTALRDFRQEVAGIILGLSGRRHASRARRLVASGGVQAPAAPAAPAATPPRPAAPSLPQPRPNRVAGTSSVLAHHGETPRPGSIPAGLEVVAIGVSTGGPNALKSVIPRLPRGLGVPILLVQHMPATFTKALAESLDRYSEVSVREAVAGEPVLPDTVYLAPGGVHMVVRSERAGLGPRLVIDLDDGPPVNSCKPSVDVLMLSLAKVYGAKVLAVIMTGMGNDGQAGVAALKKNGGYCLSQTEDSCVVYGMPRAVDEAGLSDERVGLEQLAERIAAVLRQSNGKGA